MANLFMRQQLLRKKVIPIQIQLYLFTFEIQKQLITSILKVDQSIPLKIQKDKDNALNVFILYIFSYLCHYLSIINKFKIMSKGKLPVVPLFQNMLQKQDIQNKMYRHKKRLYQLRHAKSKFTIDPQANEPYKELFEQNKKKVYFLQTKYTQIQRQNRFLFEKIAQINKNSKNKSKKKNVSLQRMKSLNITLRKKQIQQIQIENAKMFGRIQKQKASISFRQCEKQFSKTRKLSQKLSKIEKYRAFTD